MRKAWDNVQRKSINHTDYQALTSIKLDKLFEKEASELFLKVEPLFRPLGVMYRTIDLIPANALFMSRIQGVRLQAVPKTNSTPIPQFVAPPLILSGFKQADNQAFFELLNTIGKASQYNDLSKKHAEALKVFNAAPNVNSLQTLQLSIGNLRNFYEGFLSGRKNFEDILQSFIKTLDEVDENALKKIFSPSKLKG